jgi:hypothetical protein
MPSVDSLNIDRGLKEKQWMTSSTIHASIHTDI